MDPEKVGKWVVWILGLVLAALGYINGNPHPTVTAGGTPAQPTK